MKFPLDKLRQHKLFYGSLLFAMTWIFVAIIPMKLSAQQIPEKPVPARFVNDFAQLLSGDEASFIEQKLKGYYDSTSTQIVVVIVKSLEGEEAWNYAQQLGQKWGVGQDKKDNGIVFLISKEDRKINISVGYGLEHLIPDIYAKRIIRDIVSPNFKAGNYTAGIDGAINRMIELSSGAYQADPNQGKDQPSSGDLFWIIVFIVIFLIIISIANRRNRGSTFNRRGQNSWMGPTFFNPGGGGGFFDNNSSGGGGFDFGGGDFGGGGASGDW